MARARLPRSPTKCAAACFARPRPRRSPQSRSAAMPPASPPFAATPSVPLAARRAPRTSPTLRSCPSLRTSRATSACCCLSKRSKRLSRRTWSLSFPVVAPVVSQSAITLAQALMSGGDIMRRLICLVLACLVTVPTLALAQELTLKRVMLSSAGLGYFEYEARVDGDAVLKLTVPLDQVDDILKSLVVYDDRGGVGGLSLPGREPLKQAFNDLPFDQSALQTPADLLSALKG